jgi:hypothetical protein
VRANESGSAGYQYFSQGCVPNTLFILPNARTRQGRF